MCCCGGGDEDDCRCRPLGFLLGLPFAFVALLLSVIGVIIWIVGHVIHKREFVRGEAYKCHIGFSHKYKWLTLSCLCPCCFCVTVIIELALALIKAPFSVMKWFTEQIPC